MRYLYRREQLCPLAPGSEDVGRCTSPHCHVRACVHQRAVVLR